MRYIALQTFCVVAMFGIGNASAEFCIGDPDFAQYPNYFCFPSVRSFADVVLEYSPTCDRITYNNASNSLGPPNFVGNCDGTGWVSLGNGGVLKVLFLDNKLTNSGSASPDLWVSEIGDPPGHDCNLESYLLQLRPGNAETRLRILTAGIGDTDGDGFFPITWASRTTHPSGQVVVDLDNWLPGHAAGTLLFDAVRIEDDVSDSPGCSSQGGCDIDAVGAISSCDECGATTIRSEYWTTIKVLYR